MLIATRVLKLCRASADIEIPVRIFAPVQSAVDWSCRFEIDWPEEKRVRIATGIDAIQSLLLALQMIGAQIYTSDYHTAGNLMWQAPGQGYGFPVPNNIRDLLMGNDAIYGA